MANVVGKIKWLNMDKGFGFIGPDDGGADVFLHITEVQKIGFPNLPEGQSVQFDLTHDRQGRICACNLVLLEDEASGAKTETGTLKWFSWAKGYGFIAPDSGAPDVFLHVSDVERAGVINFSQRQRIQYELARRHGKVLAVDLKLL